MNILVNSKDFSIKEIVKGVGFTPVSIDKLMSDGKNNLLNTVAYYLEKIDDKIAAELCKGKSHNVKIVKKVIKTLVTTVGELKFKRRYYFNNSTKEYFYPLDYILQLKKYQRYTNEFLVRLCVEASKDVYSKASERVLNGFVLSKSTVHRIIKNTKVCPQFKQKELTSNENTVHVQIDEKYVSTRNGKLRKGGKQKKVRLITATIFQGIEQVGRNRKKLKNRIILSSFSLGKLAKKINFYLENTYKIKKTDHIYLSGDLAPYIQNFNERIGVVEAIYVPDKFHIIRDVRKLLGCNCELKDLKNKEYVDHLAYAFSICDQDNIHIKKMNKFFKNLSDSLANYFKEDYCGCSQEGMNSHYYSTRFGKLGYTFNKKTIEKLCLIRECFENGIDIKLNIESTPCTVPLIDNGRIRMELEKYYIDKFNMKEATRKMFDKIIYGF